jgi:integrase
VVHRKKLQRIYPSNQEAKSATFEGAIKNRSVNGPQKEENLARRRFQRGQLLLLGSKKEPRWYGRWRESALVDGKEVRRNMQEFLDTKEDYPTRRLALRALQDRLATINSPTFRARPTARFSQFAARWESDVVPQFKPSTATNCRLQLRKWLVPFFGQWELKDIDGELVQRFVSVVGGKIAPKTVRNLVITLRSMWRSARAWRYVAHDPFDGLVLPKPNPAQRFFFSGDDVHRIIAEAEEPYRTFYGLLAELGLRCGELCAITRDDIDLERRLAIVRQSAWRGKIGSPKTANSVRVLDLSPECVAHLSAFLQSWRPNPARLLFATRNGTPWDANLLCKRHFRPLLQRLGIEEPRGNGFHALRHANSTLMDRFGIPLKVRQDRLGHVDPRMTLGVYTHSTGEDSKRAARELGALVWKAIPYANVREKEKGLEGSTSKPLFLN